ncbi:uncharacterized protein BN777_00856 [Bacteroides sp. CAG:770]|nr:uncharacterized protein BN777_00856 [Bacteroides sp. CAG:770]
MKKLIVLFSAVAALAACSKNEVVPAVSGENVEISYKVAPRTKADPQTFNTHNVFASWAYYLPNGKSWDANRTEAKEYISSSEISFNDGVWKDKKISYYWPNGGSLTFFAYSLNRNNLELKHEETGHSYPIECHNADNAYGINATIDLKENKNLDLLVAEIAKDRTQNEKFYSLNGVPTLFKHKFSRIQFAVKKKEEYTGATITLNSIIFNNVAYAGHYSQFNKEEGHDTFTQDYCKEADLRGSIVYTTTDFAVTSATDYAPVTETDETNYIYMPQDFKNVTEDKIATIEVKYTVTDKEGISKTYTKTLKVKDIFDSWKIGKRYTFNLIFSLNEINWAPAVGDWENEIKNIDVVPGEVKPADGSISADGDTTTDEQC